MTVSIPSPIASSSKFWHTRSRENWTWAVPPDNPRLRRNDGTDGRLYCEHVATLGCISQFEQFKNKLFTFQYSDVNRRCRFESSPSPYLRTLSLPSSMTCSRHSHVCKISVIPIPSHVSPTETAVREVPARVSTIANVSVFICCCYYPRRHALRSALGHTQSLTRIEELSSSSYHVIVGFAATSAS